MSETISDLFKRKSLGEISFERIVIETTGLADPGPIIQTLFVDLFLANNTRMDGIVTVVDAANGFSTLDSQFEAVSQAAIADLIILSKTDLVSHSKIKKLDPSKTYVMYCRSGLRSARACQIMGKNEFK